MKTLLPFILSLLISGLTCVKTSFAQSVGARITGVVSDSASSKPMDFITVNLMVDKTTAVKADFTKTDGTFSFTNLKPAKYSVVLVGVGYQNKIIEADLSDSTKKELNLGQISLSSTSVGLKEVT